MDEAARPDVPPPPDDDELARYEHRFREEQQRWQEILSRNAERLARGEYSLAWLDTATGKVTIEYRPVHTYTLTNDVSYIEPKKRVY